MAKHLMLAMTNPLSGREAEYNRWYDEVAYPIYKSLPGLAPLGRFKAVDVPAMFPFQMDNNFQYLSLYTFETEDPVAFVEKVGMTLHSRGDYYFSETIDQSRFCEPIYVSINEINFEPIDRYERLKSRLPHSTECGDLHNGQQ
ncbi:hypothetical protein KRR38_00910 [Novosphingobium sp. G106]|uniref:hypothetical protein n=1 Tax=Novosphingobium sp. G106 TaxID=2849500 RepID=UPI001C2CD1BD|nr:hypothetical protein [Novosphingobium sp. G106]MBV1686265.1 hypothetical protein [Novosphingobium sp. G106]